MYRPCQLTTISNYFLFAYFNINTALSTLDSSEIAFFIVVTSLLQSLSNVHEFNTQMSRGYTDDSGQRWGSVEQWEQSTSLSKNTILSLTPDN